MQLKIYLFFFTCLLFLQVSAASEQYLKDRIPPENKRYNSMVRVLELMQQRKAKILVETGTARYGDANMLLDGGSSIIFAHWAKTHRAQFYSVDISPEAVMQARKVIKPYSLHAKVICSDSIAFLKNFKKPIDFLYLDSFDYDLGDPLPSQTHHLHEIRAVYNKLHSKSIVMIDDCDLPGGGKGKLAIAFLQSKGWKIVFEGYQVILIRS